MRFDICLVAHKESIPVAHLIKIRCIRIVTRTDRIEIMLLHQSEILLDLCNINCKSCDRIRVMPVYAAQLDCLSIEI